MNELWRRVPVVVRAVIVGSLVSLLGSAPWAIFAGLNIATTPSVPWSVVPAALYLWFFWRYLGGWGWPRSTSEARRANLRIAPLSGRTWAWALLAGILGTSCVGAIVLVAEKMVRVPQASLPELEQLPTQMLIAAIVMTSVFAGVVEEAAFRGYMQRPIERRHGPIVAILVVGFLFALAHFSHGWMGWQLIPVYMLSAAVYGTLAYATGSILPGVVWHAVGDVIAISLLLALKREDAVADPLIWEAGTNAAFWIEAAIAVICGAAAIPIFLMLLRARPREVAATVA